MIPFDRSAAKNESVGGVLKGDGLVTLERGQNRKPISNTRFEAGGVNNSGFKLLPYARLQLARVTPNCRLGEETGIGI